MLPPTKIELSPIPIINELISVYEILHKAIQEFPKLEKYSLGSLMEKILLECIENCSMATVLPRGYAKLQAVATASAKFDTLKIFTRLSVSSHLLSEKVYVKLIPLFGSTGAMLGGWVKETQRTI